MQGLKHKRTIAKFLCFLMILEMFVASPNVAEAKSEGIKRGTLKEITVAANEDPLTITLYDPSKPENTKVVSSTVPSWITVTKTSYYSASFTVKFQKNTSSSSRTATIQFTEGSYIWYAKITQNKPTPTPKPATKEPTKKVTTKPTQKPTPVPTKAPTPTPELTASEASLGFPADGATKTVTISGYTGTLRADRNDTWFTVSVSGGTISVTVTKNTSTARASYVDVTDTGSGRSVRIQVTQAAPIINPGPTKAPTNTPTPTPAETLPVKTKKLQFGAQGGQDTLTLDGKGYNLAFSYPDNPSVPTGWVTMSYENSKIIVKVKQNKNHAPRSMKVTITDRNTNQYAYVTINQSAAPTPTPAFLSVDREEISCESNGGEEIVTVKGKVGTLGYSFAWNPEDNSGWVRVKPEGNRLHFIIDENRTIKARTATITITDSSTKKNVVVTISQEAMSSTTTVSNDTLRAEQGTILFGCEGGTKSVRILGKSGTIRVDPTGKEGWYSATADGNIIEIRANENASFARRAYLDVTDMETGKTIQLEICQDAKPVQPLEAVNHVLVFSSEKEAQTVSVTGRVGSLVLSRKNNDTWFTVREDKGSVVIEVEENIGASRTGYLDISDKGSGQSTWVVIYQNSKYEDTLPKEERESTPLLSVDGYRCNFGWTGASEKIPLNSDEQPYHFDYKWNREDNSGWARVEFDGKNLCVKVSENGNVNYRSVVVSVYGPTYYMGEITITQDGAPANTIMRSDLERIPFGTNGGAQEIHITGTYGTPIFVKQTNASWLTLEKVGLSSEGYVIRLSASANYGEQRREDVFVVDMRRGQQICLYVIQAASPQDTNMLGDGKGTKGYTGGLELPLPFNKPYLRIPGLPLEDNNGPLAPFGTPKSEYVVKYDANGGSNPPATQTKLYSLGLENYLVLSEDTPKRIGYDFQGWGLTPSDKVVAYKPGDQYTRNMDVTLYAIWKSNGFWDRFEVTYSIHEPYNSAVASAKRTSLDQYWKIFQERKETYIDRVPYEKDSNPWEPIFVDVGGVERISNRREKKYIHSLQGRLLLHYGIGTLGAATPVVPDAAYFLGYYLSARGEKVTYGLSSYLYGRNILTDCFNSEVNSIMRKMETGLVKGQSIVFTDKNAGKNKISFTTNSFSNTDTDNSREWNGFLGIKEGSYGVSAKCSYDGDLYTMELCFYLQDYYDFYYEATDWNNQGGFAIAGVYGDELAFLVPWGLAKPFENTGVVRVRINWYEGQEVNIVSPSKVLRYSYPDAQMEILDFK